MARRFSAASSIQWIGFDPKPYQKNKRFIPQKETGADFQLLSSAATYIQSDLVSAVDGWENSSLFWILSLSAPAKGKLGRHLIATWCASKGFSVDRAEDKNANLIINGHRFATKFSTLWSNHIYKFQQIRDTGYDFLVCLGISPSDAHCWVFDRKTILSHVTIQHKGTKGSEYWLSVNPTLPHEWLLEYGGSLDQAHAVMKKLLK
jgi:hypothetical protein